MEILTKVYPIFIIIYSYNIIMNKNKTADNEEKSLYICKKCLKQPTLKR